MKSFNWDPWLMAAARPKQPAVSTDSESCSYAELVERADGFAGALRALGVGEGDVVATDVQAGPDLFALLLASLRAGFGLFPVHHGFSDAEQAELVRQARAVLSVTAGPASPLTRSAHIPLTQLLDTGSDTVPTGSRGGFLLYATSGTTGVPQVVARTQPWYPYRGVAVQPKYFAGPDFGPHIMANPNFHLGTLGPALYALQAGSAVVVQSAWSASRFVELVDAHRADSAFVSPNYLPDLVQAGVAPRHRPKVVFHGGMACSVRVKKAVIDLLGPVLHEYYGTSAGLITEITSAEWLERPGSVGRALPGVQVWVMGDGTPAAPEQIGEVHARLRAIDHSESTSTQTGDIGYLDAAGYLFILGRMTDSGDGGQAEASLENQIRALPGVTDAAVLPARDGQFPGVLLVETHCADQAEIAAIEALVKSRSAEVGLDVDVRPDGSFPRTSSGKLLRHYPAPEKTRFSTVDGGDQK